MHSATYSGSGRTSGPFAAVEVPSQLNLPHIGCSASVASRSNSHSNTVTPTPLAQFVASVEDFVSSFLCWAAQHDLDRTWTVDEIWFLVTEDFAPANDLIAPPRRVFLGCLKKHAEVTVEKDKRIYSRDGRVKRKTTMYTLPSRLSSEALQAVDQVELAA